MKTYLITFILSLGIVANSFGTKFANQFTEFELPPSWNCALEGSEWVCQSLKEEKRKEAIIVLAAKLKGDQDSIDQYLAYLKGAKSFTSVSGKPMKSEPKYAKTANLNGQAWVDALHLESEIPGYYTRYLATVKEDIGVLVTYSIHKDKYQDYLAEFESMIKTLKVFRKEGGINTSSNKSLFDQAQVPTSLNPESIFPGNKVDVAGGKENAPKANSGGVDDFTYYLLIGGIVLIILFIIKKKRQG